MVHIVDPYIKGTKPSCRIKRAFFAFIVLFFIVSCAGIPPKKDYARARMAVLSAEKSGARLDSPVKYDKALKYLKLSERAFYERLYSEAEKYALMAKGLAEEAEEETLKKKKGGGTVIEDI
ncbi:MAG TPA: hypothetical protein VJB34_01055 [Bdellovibrionota bacterium]|nr:hypothetical protein [Bdellovibrionota bacterium]